MRCPSLCDLQFGGEVLRENVWRLFLVACILLKKVAHDLQKHAPNLLPYW